MNEAPWPAFSLGFASDGDVDSWLQRARWPLKDALRRLKATAVVVQGDTMSARAGAQAAFDFGVPYAHVEAGVRSGNVEEPWPEEWLRRDISRLASTRCLHLAPTPHAADNLRAEDVRGEIVLTGNTVVSALDQYAALRESRPVRPQMLITMHRREWHEQSDAVENVAAALDDVARRHAQHTLLWPVHPAIAHRVKTKNVLVYNPLNYLTFVTALSTSAAVLTDSGGVVEEAVTLGIPVGIMRRFNDRPEAVSARRALMEPPTGAGAECAALRLLRGEIPRWRSSAIFGTPSAAANAADVIVAWLATIR